MNGNLMTTVGPDSGCHCVVLTYELLKMNETTSLIDLLTFF